MIVTCQQCATQFHLDDAKVPEAGIKVRCSRCKFAFMVESPEQSSADHGASVAQDTLATGAVGTADESESDWQFSEDIEGQERLSVNGLDPPARDAAAAAVDDLLGPVARADVPASDADLESGVEDPFDAAEGRDAFGIGHDFGGSDLDGDESRAIDGIELAGDVVAGGPDEADLEPPIETDDIGDPPTVDTPGEREVDVPSAATDDEAASEAPFDDGMFEDLDTALSGSPLTPAIDLSAETELSAETAPWAAATDSDEPKAAAFDVDVETQAANVWMARARAGLGWALTSSLVGVALFLGLVPRPPAASSESVPLSVAGFEAQAVRGSWIDNATAGPIYVVSGSLRAASSVPPAGVELRIRLLDDHGEAIPAESAAVGPPIPVRQLREASPRDLRDRQERGAPQYLRQSLAPGERRPFHAVFAGVAPAAAAFEFQVAEAANTGAPEERITEMAGAAPESPAP